MLLNIRKAILLPLGLISWDSTKDGIPPPILKPKTKIKKRKKDKSNLHNLPSLRAKTRDEWTKDEIGNPVVKSEIITNQDVSEKTGIAVPELTDFDYHFLEQLPNRPDMEKVKIVKIYFHKGHTAKEIEKMKVVTYKLRSIQKFFSCFNTALLQEKEEKISNTNATNRKEYANI